MNFSTQVNIAKNKNPLDFSSKIITIGSCFSDSIGEKFKHYNFDVQANPFGVVFNPKSIEKLLYRAVNSIWFTENELVYQNDLWHSFDIHSDFSSSSKSMILNELNASLANFIEYVKATTHIYVTYGTAWVYVLKENNQVVSNCHKLPQINFDKVLLSVTEIQQSIDNTIKYVRLLSPNCTIVFTVSPVRHIKDGFIENQRSKSHLITAIHSSIESQNNYFPSYEIMMDELRDYRYYAPDMLHPSNVAIDYIWEKFIDSSIHPNLFETLTEINNIQKSLAHKPFNPDTEQHQIFLNKLQTKIQNIQNIHPKIKF